MTGIYVAAGATLTLPAASDTGGTPKAWYLLDNDLIIYGTLTTADDSTYLSVEIDAGNDANIVVETGGVITTVPSAAGADGGRVYLITDGGIIINGDVLMSGTAPGGSSGDNNTFEAYSGDFVVTVRGGEDVEVAVSIHVRREHAGRAVGRRADRVRREVLTAVVFVPRDLVVCTGSGENVEVAVSVHVRGEHRGGIAGGRTDGMVFTDAQCALPSVRDRSGKLIQQPDPEVMVSSLLSLGDALSDAFLSCAGVRAILTACWRPQIVGASLVVASPVCNGKRCLSSRIQA